MVGLEECIYYATGFRVLLYFQNSFSKTNPTLFLIKLAADNYFSKDLKL